MPDQTVQHHRASRPVRRVVGHVQAFRVDVALGLIGTAAAGGVLVAESLPLASACVAVAVGCGGLMAVRNS